MIEKQINVCVINRGKKKIFFLLQNDGWWERKGRKKKRQNCKWQTKFLELPCAQTIYSDGSDPNLWSNFGFFSLFAANERTRKSWWVKSSSSIWRSSAKKFFIVSCAWATNFCLCMDFWMFVNALLRTLPVCLRNFRPRSKRANLGARATHQEMYKAHCL